MKIEEKIKKAEAKLAALKAEKKKIDDEILKSTSIIDSEEAQQEFLNYLNGKGLFKKKYGSNIFLLCKPEGFEKVDSDISIYGRCIEIIDQRDGWEELDTDRVSTKIKIEDFDILFQLQAKEIKTVKDIVDGFLSFYEPTEINSFSDTEVLNRIEDHLKRLDGNHENL